MCGIVGYTGPGRVADVLLNGLRRLEYRGYDSAGVAIVGKEIQVRRAIGKVANLAKEVEADIAGSYGIAHTRWATHGRPSVPNAHPHVNDAGDIAVVHNGIIDNAAVLRTRLSEKGHTFYSETDSEVLPKLISEFYQGDLLEAVLAAIEQIKGTYGMAVVSPKHPGQIVVARKGSPIAIGVGDDETIVASDVAAIVAHTSNVIFLDDDDVALVEAGHIDLRNTSNLPVTRKVSTVDWDIEAVEKGGYKHFMLKEIFDQPNAIEVATRGRLNFQEGTAYLSGLCMEPRDMVCIQRIIIAACGTSLHAGMLGEYFFEDLASIPTEVEQAAEFRYRNPIVDASTLAIVISQSGETADTLAALREAKQKGAQIAGLCNVVGATIAREAGRGVYLHAGPEIGVASTKAFTTQVSVMLMMAMKFARTRRFPRQAGIELCKEIRMLPELIREVLATADHIKEVAKRWHKMHHCFFIGRGYFYPVALEGALKLKEISYIHAEGYHAAELKHGPLALLDENCPVIALANDGPGKEKVLGNIEECRARQAPVIVTATMGDTEASSLADDVLWIPKSGKATAPVLTVVALQLFSYYVADELGCEIDQPRNLAKSVTVE